MLEFETDGVVVNCNQGAGYFSIIKLGHDIHIFGRRAKNYSNTNHLIGAFDKGFEVKASVLANSSACHNFSAFTSNEGTPFALGGQNTVADRPHSAGLYLFRTSDASTFDRGQLVVDGNHPGIVNAREIWGMLGDIDGPPSCFYCSGNQQYYVFLRANPKRGERRIQFAAGRNLKKLGGFQMLDERYIRLEEDDFFYGPCFQYIDGVFLGLLPVVNPRYTALRLVASYNGRDWVPCQDFFPKKPWFNEAGDPKPCDFPAQGFLVEEDVVRFGIHHNFLRGESDGPTYLSFKTLSREKLINLCKEKLQAYRWRILRRAIGRNIADVFWLRMPEVFRLWHPKSSEGLIKRSRQG